MTKTKLSDQAKTQIKAGFSFSSILGIASMIQMWSLFIPPIIELFTPKPHIAPKPKPKPPEHPNSLYQNLNSDIHPITIFNS